MTRCFERVLANARFFRDGLHELGFAVVAPQALAGEEHLQAHAPGLSERRRRPGDRHADHPGARRR